MKPSEKAPSIDAMLKAVFGVDRVAAIEANRCVDPPIGCGLPASEADFITDCDRAEYRISGLCPKCQSLVFGASG